MIPRSTMRRKLRRIQYHLRHKRCPLCRKQFTMSLDLYPDGFMPLYFICMDCDIGYGTNNGVSTMHVGHCQIRAKTPCPTLRSNRIRLRSFTRLILVESKTPAVRQRFRPEKIT